MPTNTPLTSVIIKHPERDLAWRIYCDGRVQHFNYAMLAYSDAKTLTTAVDGQPNIYYFNWGLGNQCGAASTRLDFNTLTALTVYREGSETLAPLPIFDENSNQQTAPTPADFPAAASGAKREKLSTTYDLFPFEETVSAYMRIAEFGAKKYAVWNWSLGLARAQIIASLLRHTWAYLRGQDRDKDSGLLHTDHILWNAVALTHNVHHNLEDGRRIEPERSYKKD